MPGGKMKFKFTKKPNGGDLVGSSKHREFKGQQDFAATNLAKRNQSKPTSDSERTDYGLPKQVGESAIGRGDVSKTTRFATSGQNKIMDVKGEAGGSGVVVKKKEIATYAQGTKGIKYDKGTKGIFSKERQKADHQELEAIDNFDSQIEKPKKMGLLSRLKRNQDEDNAYAASIDAEDEVQAKDAYLEPKETKYDNKLNIDEIASKKNSVSDSNDISELDKASFTNSTKVKTNISKGADAKLAQWQSKRGLKADGIWGKESAEAYKKEQSKKMSLKKTTTPTATKTTVSKSVPRLEYVGEGTNDYKYAQQEKNKSNLKKSGLIVGDKLSKAPKEEVKESYQDRAFLISF